MGEGGGRLGECCLLETGRLLDRSVYFKLYTTLGAFNRREAFRDGPLEK